MTAIVLQLHADFAGMGCWINEIGRLKQFPGETYLLLCSYRIWVRLYRVWHRALLGYIVYSIVSACSDGDLCARPVTHDDAFARPVTCCLQTLPHYIQGTRGHRPTCKHQWLQRSLQVSRYQNKWLSPAKQVCAYCMRTFTPLCATQESMIMSIFAWSAERSMLDASSRPMHVCACLGTQAAEPSADGRKQTGTGPSKPQSHSTPRHGQMGAPSTFVPKPPPSRSAGPPTPTDMQRRTSIKLQFQVVLKSGKLPGHRGAREEPDMRARRVTLIKAVQAICLEDASAQVRWAAGFITHGQADNQGNHAMLDLYISEKAAAVILYKRFFKPVVVTNEILSQTYGKPDFTITVQCIRNTIWQLKSECVQLVMEVDGLQAATEDMVDYMLVASNQASGTLSGTAGSGPAQQASDTPKGPLLWGRMVKWFPRRLPRMAMPGASEVDRPVGEVVDVWVERPTAYLLSQIEAGRYRLPVAFEHTALIVNQLPSRAESTQRDERRSS